MTEPVITEKANVDRLEAIFFQLLQLYDRCTEEHQLLINKEKEELGKLAQALETQVKEMGKTGVVIRQSIQDSIQTSANTVMDKVADLLVQKSHVTIEKAISKTEKHHQLIEATMDTFRREKNRSSWKMMGLTLFSSTVTSLLAVWLLLPKPTLPLTGEQLNYLRDGQMLAQIWPNLSDPEKTHLKNVADNVLHPS
jgi:hypothetical protein